MSKRSTFAQQMEGPVYVGLDVGDRYSDYCIINEGGDVVCRGGGIETTQRMGESLAD